MICKCEPIIVNFIKTFVKLLVDYEGVGFKRVVVEFRGGAYECTDNCLVMKRVVVCDDVKGWCFDEKETCKSEKE